MRLKQALLAGGQPRGHQDWRHGAPNVLTVNTPVLADHLLSVYLWQVVRGRLDRALPLFHYE